MGPTRKPKRLRKGDTRQDCEISSRLDAASDRWKVTVMGPWNVGGGTSSSGPWKLLLLLALAQLLCNARVAIAGKPHECVVERCSHQYQKAMESHGLLRGPNVRYCAVLGTYLECLRATARGCRGNLKYHTMSSLIMQWINEYNCSYLRTQEREASVPPSLSPIVPSKCAYRGKGAFATCALFGDPHLRTFADEWQTCKAIGAWPLVDNSYLAVQVTNEAVVKGFKASATTKITIIIKEHGPCSQQKTYEAVTDNLPATFVDGTQGNSVDNSVRIREKIPGRHVEIALKYVDTVIKIRQVGLYLTFVVRMPKDVANAGSNAEGLQLCLRGCPNGEKIDPRNAASLPASSNAMSHGEAVAKCRAHNFSHFYFDSCVFDLLTTGDETFLQAAKEAMMDGRALNPDEKHSSLESGPKERDPEPPAAAKESAVRSGTVDGSAPNVYFWVTWWTLVLLVTNR